MDLCLACFRLSTLQFEFYAAFFQNSTGPYSFSYFRVLCRFPDSISVRIEYGRNRVLPDRVLDLGKMTDYSTGFLSIHQSIIKPQSKSRRFTQ